jgi:hypothetical protein
MHIAQFTHLCIVVRREHPGLNRGQSDLQSDALPLSYTPYYVTNLHKNVKNDVRNKIKTNMLTLLDQLTDCMSQ